MAGNDDLHPILRKIHKTLGDSLKEIQKVKGEIEKVHTTITESTQKILDAINETIQAQAEMKMMEHMIEVKSILPQIEAEEERIKIEQKELDAQLKRISDRYEKKHEELDEKAASRIRDLGSHIFEIEEDQFEDGIETPFAEHVTTVWMSLQNHNATIRQERQEQVESTTGDVVTEIHRFVQRQHDLKDKIDSIRTDFDRSVTEPTKIQLPYYTVVTEVDGTTQKTVIGPSQIENNDQSGTTLTPLPGIEDLISDIGVNTTHTETIDSETISRNLEPNVTADQPLVSYTGAVEKALPSQLKVEMEGPN